MSSVKKLAHYIQSAKKTVVFTGAGMPTESGIPDFRSSKGIWKDIDPMKLASTHALEYNREEFIKFYQMRIQGLSNCKPHQGHFLLAEWEKRGYIHSIITQNVDGFHQQAGSEKVTELHGSIRKIRCTVCHRVDSSNAFLAEEYPICTCGGFMRPCVVLFGESLPEEALNQAEMETSTADLFIVLGSSLQVSPANYFPMEAKRNHAELIIINMEPTEFDHYADLIIHDRKIGEILDEANRYFHDMIG